MAWTFAHPGEDMTPNQVLSALWAEAGLPGAALDHAVLTGTDPVLPSSFHVGALAQAGIAAAGLAAAELHHLRTGRRQRVSVDMRHAAAEFRSERLLRVDGKLPGELWDRIAGLYPCRDGWVRLHTNFPHHRDGLLRLLGCAYDRNAVGHALHGWTATGFEDAAAEAGMAVTALRPFAQWDAHPQGRAVAGLPLLSIERIGDAPPQPLPDGTRPLEGVRVLDLTRVIAGPVCGRTLAAHGADVLLVTGPHLPAMVPEDMGRGKLSTQLDLRGPDGRAALEALVRSTDVFLQGYRPGSLAARGFAPADTARLRPGIVHVSLSAYGQAGPWGNRRGFDSLVQTASGLNVAEAEAFGQATPRPLPAQALDHATGYLLALGTMAALHRRATVGGSWHVQASLARTGLFLRSLGRVPDGPACPDPGAGTEADLLEESDSGWGRMEAVRHAALLDETPARWARPSVPLGTHPVRWPG